MPGRLNIVDTSTRAERVMAKGDPAKEGRIVQPCERAEFDITSCLAGNVLAGLGLRCGDFRHKLVLRKISYLS